MANFSFKYPLFFLILALFIFVAVGDSGKTKKIAKAVVKGAIMHKAGKHGKHGRSFPIWAIVLIVLLLTGGLGLGVFAFCLLRKRLTQSCFPKRQFV